MSALLEQLQHTPGDSYVVERELGGGGMSRVFLASEPSLGRQIVVKILPPDTSGQVSMERFKREIRVAASLQHPHIIPVLAAGDIDGLPWYSMPFVRGDALRDRLLRTPPPTVNEVVHVLRDVASALACAHGEGIVHRDIKPENIILFGGAAVVTDFGVAEAMHNAADADAHR